VWVFVGFCLVSKSTTYPSYPSPHPQLFPTFSPPCPISERSCSVNTYNSFMLMPVSHPWVMKASYIPISWGFEPFSRTTASSVSQMQQVYSPTSFWRRHSKIQMQLYVFLTQGKLTDTRVSPHRGKLPFSESCIQTGKYRLTRTVIREGERRHYQTRRPKKHLRNPKCYHRRTIQTPSLQTRRDQCVLSLTHTPRQNLKKRLTYLTQSPLLCFQDLPIAKVSIFSSERLLEYVLLFLMYDL